MEKINKKVTKKCNICYQAGIIEGIQQEQKRIKELIELLKSIKAYRFSYHCGCSSCQKIEDEIEKQIQEEKKQDG